MNNEWITDREPVEEDADYGIPGYNGLVFATDSTGKVIICSYCWTAHHGFPWQPIMIPEAYVKPKRYKVKAGIEEMFYVIDVQFNFIVIKYLTTYEAADEIATVLERVKPWKG